MRLSQLADPPGPFDTLATPVWLPLSETIIPGFSLVAMMADSHLGAPAFACAHSGDGVADIGLGLFYVQSTRNE